MKWTNQQIDSYLQRTGLATMPSANVEGLAVIQHAHALSVAFENLTTLAGEIPVLDHSSLFGKLVASQRGGYCFEQNLLMASLLESIGFEVTRLAARVVWHLQKHDAEAMAETLPRTHLCLLVKADDRQWIVDVGFGGLTPVMPVEFTVGLEQPGSHETLRLMSRGDACILQAKLPDGWKSMYRFDLQSQQAIDLEMMNWWVSTRPDSRFVSNLVMARPHALGRHALFNTELTSYDLAGKASRRNLHSVEELRSVIGSCFGVVVPESELLDRQFERLVAEAAAGS